MSTKTEMNYMVSFIYIDHTSDQAASVERTTINATSEDEVGRKFFESGDMDGCYIQSITPVVW